jgi:adenylyltransferase/sulfurtransferase
MELNEEQIERYSRQIILSNFGGKGQKKLLEAKVLVVGAGGLGSPCAYYLTAAGIGKIGIVDADKAELNNLQRQILHSTKDIGKVKVISAKEKLNALNPGVEIIAHQQRLTSENALEIIKNYDLVVDGSDNFPTRYLMNDACVFLKKPLIHAGVFRYEGQVMTIIPGKGPCYRCLFPEPPPPGLVPSCQEAGILGVIPGILGLLQANEVIKYILNIGDLLVGRLLVSNLLEPSFRLVKVPQDENCLVCSKTPKITELIDYEQFCQMRR